jgi:hypothetical protein
MKGMSNFIDALFWGKNLYLSKSMRSIFIIIFMDLNFVFCTKTNKKNNKPPFFGSLNACLP